MSLTGKATQGARWGAIRSVVLQLFTVVSTMVLARILTPADFGLVAAATVVVGMFKLLTRFGFGASLVRRAELDDVQTSTVFWIATGVGSVALFLTALLATPLARLIGQPEVAPMIMVLGSLIPLGLAGRVGESLLLRELRFRMTAFVDVAGVAVYLAVAIGLALMGFGPWAIVIGHVAERVVHTIALLVLARWRPRLRFDRRLVRDEMGFSGGMLGNAWLRYLNTNLDYWVVSAVLGAEALGAYFVAYVIPNLIRQRFTSIAQEVLYPILSRIGDDVARARSAYLRVVKVVGFITIPAMVGVAVLSDLVIGLAFGDRWEAAIGPLPILALSAAVMSVSVVSGSLTMAAGRPHLLIPADGAGVVTLGVGLWLTAPSGDLTMMSWSVLAAAVVTAILRHLIVGRLIDLPLSRFLIEVLPIAISTGVMAGALLLTKSWTAVELGEPIAAVVLVASGFFIYLAVFRLLFRRTLREQIRDVRTVAIPARGP